MTVQATPYEGALSEIGSVKEGWRDSTEFRKNEWQTNGAWKVKVSLDPNAVPRPGTYLVRFLVVSWARQSPEDSERFGDAIELIRSGEVSAEEAMESFQGEEWGAPATVSFATGEVRRALTILDLRPHKFVHVESVGTVLTFWLVLATLVTALSAFAVAVFQGGS